MRVLNSASPWAEDPYDAFFSLGIFFVGLVGAITSVRFVLCRAGEPLAARRVDGLIRGCRLILGTILVTFAFAWVSVVASRSLGGQPGLTSGLIALLAIETVSAAGGLLVLNRAAASVVGLGTAGPRPDGLDDLVGLTRQLGPLGPLSRPADRFAGLVRRHPLSAALIVAASFGTFFGMGAALEGDPIALTLLIALIGAAAIFAFLIGAGSYLHLVDSDSTGTSFGRQGRAIVIGIALSAASVPTAVAFRDFLWWVVGSTADSAGIPELATLLAVVALTTLVVATVVALRLDRTKRRP